MLLHGQVRVALEEQRVFADQIGLGKPLIHVAEFEIDGLVEIAARAVVVDARRRLGDGVQRRGDGGQLVVRDGDEIEGSRGCFFTGGRDGRHGIAHEAHGVRAQRMLVLAHGQDPERDGQVLAGEHGLHAGQRAGFGRVDAGDLGVGVRAAQQLAEEHPRQGEVVGELGGARDLRGRVDFAGRLLLITGGHTGFPWPASRLRRASVPPPAPRPRRS